jgi:signal transduction histidine kinase
VAAENEVVKEVAGFIRSEVDRTNSLVTRFLDFARPSPLHRSVSDLNEIVERTIADIERKNAGSGGKISITKDLRPIGKFSFDATLIESSISNIVQNAADAMADGGNLRVSTWRNGEFAEIVVSDTGPGIPPEQMENIFNPFFTTKPRGVGLGLALVSKFIDGHGGKITVSSSPGEGATFRIQLPFGIDT